MKRKILLYYEGNKWSNLLITYISQLQKKGFIIEVLTISPRGTLHKEFEKMGIKAFAYSIPKNISILYYLRHIIFLTLFLKSRNIDIVHSHVQQANLIATISNLFSKAKLIVYRHHYRPFGIKLTFGEWLFDKIIHLLAPIVVVLSGTVKKGIAKYEHVPNYKMVVIPNIYDFSRYPRPDIKRTEQIRRQYNARLLLIMVARLIKLKRPKLVFRAVKELIEEGLDIKLLVAGEGPERFQLEQWIYKHRLSDRIILLGFTNELINYMNASDMLVSASMTDASNSSVKEIALLEKIVAVPDYVGDFSEYIVDGYNGFLLPLEGTKEHLKDVIRRVYKNPEKYYQFGKRLKKAVLKRFDVNQAHYIIDRHIILTKSLLCTK